MTKREIILIVAIILVLMGVVALAFWKSPPPVLELPKSSASSPHAAVATSPWQSMTPLNEYPQLSLKTMSKDEALKIYVERLRHDIQADWKIPISFYGKVIDENNQPVTGAVAHLDWTTLGTPGNSDERETLSDGNGLFSLTGQHGKFLNVHVKKEGYYTVNGAIGGLSFEFAQPSDPNYYEPDPSNPVIFHLRKKGKGTKLFSKELDVTLNNYHPQDRVNLIQGFIKPDGALIITSDKSKFLPGAQPFPWTVSLSMTEGGLVETTNQFPFMAPESGYIATVTIDMTNTDRNVWRGSVTKTYYFYLPSTNTYGRLTMNTSSGLPFVSLSYAYNRTPGNRVLEPAAK